MKSSRLSLEVALTDRVTFTVAAGDRASYDAAKEAVLDLRLPVLWLFDGLDEVAQDDRMAPVLESFISSTSKALSAALGRTDDRVVVLSREERDSRRCPFPPGTYTSVLLLPWSADEVRRYVQCVAASLGCDALAATRMERSCIHLVAHLPIFCEAACSLHRRHSRWERCRRGGGPERMCRRCMTRH